MSLTTTTPADPDPVPRCSACGHHICTTATGLCGAILNVGAISIARCQCPGAPTCDAELAGPAWLGCSLVVARAVLGAAR